MESSDGNHLLLYSQLREKTCRPPGYCCPLGSCYHTLALAQAQMQYSSLASLPSPKPWLCITSGSHACFGCAQSTGSCCTVQACTWSSAAFPHGYLRKSELSSLLGTCGTSAPISFQELAFLKSLSKVIYSFWPSQPHPMTLSSVLFSFAFELPPATLRKLSHFLSSL